MRNYPYQIISDIVTVSFIISQQLWGLHLNSQVPERSRGPRACCARSGTNGKGGVRSLQKIFGGAEMVIPIRNSQIFYESCLKLIYFNLILLKIFRKKISWNFLDSRNNPVILTDWFLYFGETRFYHFSLKFSDI